MYLAIGAVTQDKVGEGTYVPGGTVSYAAVAAKNLGQCSTIVTVAGSDYVCPPELDDVTMHCRLSGHTATFENRYDENGRQQYLLHNTGKLVFSDLPYNWRGASVLHIAPLANELDVGIMDEFSHWLTLLTPQGWLRSWDAAGLITLQHDLELVESTFNKAGVVVLSDEDLLMDYDLELQYADLISLLVVTKGKHGATVYTDYGKLVRHFPARPVERVVDPTGAGDIFAAAFATEYYSSEDPWEAARLANVMASMSVEGNGLGGIPDWLRVAEYMRGVVGA